MTVSCWHLQNYTSSGENLHLLFDWTVWAAAETLFCSDRKNLVATFHPELALRINTKSAFKFYDSSFYKVKNGVKVEITEPSLKAPNWTPPTHKHTHTHTPFCVLTIDDWSRGFWQALSHIQTHTLSTYTHTHMCCEGPPSTTYAPPVGPKQPHTPSPSLSSSTSFRHFLLFSFFPLSCSSLRHCDMPTPRCLHTCAKCIFSGKAGARATAKVCWGWGGVGGGKRRRGRAKEGESETEDRWFKPEKKQSDEAKEGKGGGESS